MARPPLRRDAAALGGRPRHRGCRDATRRPAGEKRRCDRSRCPRSRTAGKPGPRRAGSARPSGCQQLRDRERPDCAAHLVRAERAAAGADPARSLELADDDRPGRGVPQPACLRPGVVGGQRCKAAHRSAGTRTGHRGPDYGVGRSYRNSRYPAGRLARPLGVLRHRVVGLDRSRRQGPAPRLGNLSPCRQGRRDPGRGAPCGRLEGDLALRLLEGGGRAGGGRGSTFRHRVAARARKSQAARDAHRPSRFGTCAS